MEEYHVKEHFLDRIYGEYQAYKVSVLSCPNIGIFSRCYEIHIMMNLYNILAEKADTLQENVLASLLQRRNILSGLYESWLKKGGSGYSELESHVDSEIENIMKGTGRWCI